ncbi:MAG: hypothetical protein V3U50_03980 [Acidimicrobiia bacterium]
MSNLAVELAGTSAFEFGEPLTAELKGLAGTHRLIPLQWKHS